MAIMNQQDEDASQSTSLENIFFILPNLKKKKNLHNICLI